MLLEQTSKKCSECQEVKGLGSFHRKSSSSDGYHLKCKDCRKVESKDYYRDNRDLSLAKSKARADLDRESHRARSKKHYDQDPEPYKKRAMEYRRHKESVTDEYVDRLVVLEMDDGVCGICGADVDLMNYDIDHVIPFSKGGRHNYGNVQVACPPCNRFKATKNMEDLVK